VDVILPWTAMPQRRINPVNSCSKLLQPPSRTRNVVGPTAGSAWVVGLLLLAGVMAGCGGPDSLGYANQPEFRVDYTMSSTAGAATLPTGQWATFLVGDCSDASCGTLTNIHQVFTGVAGGSNTVPVGFSVYFSGGAYYFISVYLDANQNHVMDSGDIVWGNSPTSFTGLLVPGELMFDPLINTGTFEQPSILGPTTTYTGSPRTY
jgi:hypothetical protein